MADIFISYAHEDESRVLPIVKALHKNGWSVFWDKTIPPGEQWHVYISKALNASPCVIVVWSRHAIASDSVIEEAHVAKTKGVLVPLRIDAVEPPLGFGLFQAPDFSDWKNNTSHQAFQKLIGAIESKISSSAHTVITPTPAKEPNPVPSASSERVSAFACIPSNSKTERQKKVNQSWLFKIKPKQAVLVVVVVMPVILLVVELSGRKLENIPAGIAPIALSKPAFPDSAAVKVKQEVDARPKPAAPATNMLKIGDKYGGGIVFYVDGAGHGLIATEQDLPGGDKYSWESAKEACRKLGNNGYSDWRLPDKDELNKLYHVKSAVGGFEDDYYWNSTEFSAGSAWNQGFGDEVQTYNLKYSEWRVRPVRAF